MTPDPAVIAASLSRRARLLVGLLEERDYSWKVHGFGILARLDLVGFSDGAWTITPLGRAVAAAIRERE
jgi:hypothetical protein